MSDLTTIFVKGGEHIDKAAYIQQRDEAERLREKCMNKDAEIERLRAVVDAALDMRGIYGLSTNMEKALAALEEALWQ